MPKHGLTPEQKKWAQQMLKHFNLADPQQGMPEVGKARHNERVPEGGSAKRERVLIKRNPQDQILKQAHQFVAEVEALKIRQESLVAKVKDIDLKTRKLLVTEEHKATFAALHNKLYATLQLWNKNYKQFEPTAKHISLLKILLDKIDRDRVEMEGLHLQAVEYADKALQKEQAGIWEFERHVEEARKQRVELEPAQIDLAPLDSLLVRADGLLKQIKKAFQEHDVIKVKALMKGLKGMEGALKKVSAAAVKAARQQQDLAEKQYHVVSVNFVSLQQRVAKVPQSLEMQNPLFSQLKTLESELAKVAQTLQHGLSQNVFEKLAVCQDLLVSAQKFWLESTQASDEEQEGAKKQGQVDSQLKSIQNLDNYLSSALHHSALVHKSSVYGPQYDAVCLHMKSQLMSAQADLISGKQAQVDEKIQSLRKLRFQLYGWLLKAQELRDWAQKQYAGLIEEIQAWDKKRDHLQILCKASEEAQHNFQVYELELSEIKKNADAVADYLRKDEAARAQPALQDISLHLRRLPKLQAQIELD